MQSFLNKISERVERRKLERKGGWTARDQRSRTIEVSFCFWDIWGTTEGERRCLKKYGRKMTSSSRIDISSYLVNRGIKVVVRWRRGGVWLGSPRRVRIARFSCICFARLTHRADQLMKIFGKALYYSSFQSLVVGMTSGLRAGTSEMWIRE